MALVLSKSIITEKIKIEKYLSYALFNHIEIAKICSGIKDKQLLRKWDISYTELGKQ